MTNNNYNNFSFSCHLPLVIPRIHLHVYQTVKKQLYWSIPDKIS